MEQEVVDIPNKITRKDGAGGGGYTQGDSHAGKMEQEVVDIPNEIAR